MSASLPEQVARALEEVLEKARALGYSVDGKSYDDDGLTGALVDEARRLPFQPDPGPITMTETGAAMLLVQNFSDRLRYTDGRGWMRWDGARWTPQGGEDLARRCARVIGAYFVTRALDMPSDKARTRDKLMTVAHRILKASGVDGVLKEARSMPPVKAQDGDFDTDPWLLNTPSGIVDLRTGELRPHDPAAMLTRITSAPYDPAAQAPRWQQFLREVFGGDVEVVAFVRRWLGYCLSGDMREQKYLVCWGVGKNGKSTLFNAIRHILGDYAADIPVDALAMRRNAGQANPDIAKLPGVRLVIVPEWDEALRADETLLKTITGGDPVTARYLYRNSFTFQPVCKIVIFGNSKPALRGTDAGTWRRPILLSFMQQFSGARADKELPQKLRAEAAGILADLVRGCLEWQQQGLNVPERLECATKAWKEEIDDVQQFISACCVENPQARATVGALHAAYREWGGALRTPKAFGAALRERGYVTQRERAGFVVLGLGLRADV